ncbi:uncharacterized protein HD556DRAFT_509505 [Suillus plorans]|uniref:Uncharacterized protein n=1 Tax=Suillus plorans TaxID=116603 RepID=A0A9P7AP54_9AGAM|nr:uncharacterized protein HD556DRAFT_509505 [Suillus plorans]KAG1793504.1 hypothetical protein HD556DRAFT_509505 [Suillus plorans]
MSLQVNFTPSSPTRSRLDLRILMRLSLAGVLLFYQVWSRSSPVLLSYLTPMVPCSIDNHESPSYCRCLSCRAEQNQTVLVQTPFLSYLPCCSPWGRIISVDNPGIDRDKSIHSIINCLVYQLNRTYHHHHVQQQHRAMQLHLQLQLPGW